MNNILLAICLAVLVAQLAILVVVFAKISVFSREIASFLSPAGETVPSPAGLVWSAMCKQLVLEFKTTMMGLMSVQARAEKRLEGEVVQQELSANSPLLGVALQAFPSLRKMFLRNPSLVDYALSHIAKIGTTAGPSGSNGDTDAGDYASRLAKYS